MNLLPKAMLAWTGSVSCQRLTVCNCARITKHACRSPSVTSERLASGSELPLAMETLGRFLGVEGYAAVMGPEVGGGNGMCAFPVAVAMGLPIIDADTMGRAFPRVDLALPYIFNQAVPYPAAICDARGNVQVIAAAEDAYRFESMGRAACVELGSSAAMALNPLSGKVVQEYCCHRVLSMSWSMGREIYLSRLKKRDPASSIVSMRHIDNGFFANSYEAVDCSWRPDFVHR